MTEEERALLLLDIIKRTEEVRQMKAYEPWKLFATLLTAVAVSAGIAGGGLIWTLAHLAGVKP
jgi:hypothetical protein